MNRRQFTTRTGAFLIASQALQSNPSSATQPDDLPPGNAGGLLGGTFSFIENPWAFFEKNKKVFGPIFKSKILCKKVAFLSGPEAMALFLDEKNISRSGAHPPHVVQLFGGQNMAMLDGEQHGPLKLLSMKAFNRSALTHYVPMLQELVDTLLAQGAGQEQLHATEALKKLAVESICTNVLGLEPGERTDALLSDYKRVTAGMLAIPLRLPGNAYSKGIRAQKRVLAELRAIINERHNQLGKDGISRILGAQLESGRRITDAELVLELHHVILAGYIVYALLSELLLQMARQPALIEAIRTEMDKAEVGDQLNIEKLYTLNAMQYIIDEAKRTAPIVPAIFGVARQDFEVGSHRIPEGWGVWMALGLCNNDEQVFLQPEKFDPTRFAPGRAEHKSHPHAFMPQGSGPVQGHRCLGLEYSTLVAQVFLARLVQGYNWEIPEQNLDYQWDVVPPEPVDGLQVRLTQR